MDLYTVRSTYGMRDNYIDSNVLVYEVEEKPKVYMGKSIRVNKKDIGVILDGAFQNQFIMHVLREEDIPDARIKLKTKSLEVLRKQCEVLKQIIHDVEKHSIDNTPVNYRYMNNEARYKD